MKREQLFPNKVDDDKVSLSKKLTVGIIAMLVILGLFYGIQNYMTNISPETTDPCDPNASRMVKGTSNAKWPVKIDREEYCRKKRLKEQQRKE